MSNVAEASTEMATTHELTLVFIISSYACAQCPNSPGSPVIRIYLDLRVSTQPPPTSS